MNINKSNAETEKHFLYYLPIKLLKKVHLILKAQPTTLKGKIRFLKNVEKSLLSEVGKYTRFLHKFVLIHIILSERSALYVRVL